MKFTKKKLPNGLTILHEQRDVDVTTVMIASKYGYSYEQEQEKGIAHFLEHLCFKGTTTRTAREIAWEIERVGGILNAFTHEEVTAYHATLPSKHFTVAMNIMFDIYFNPTFPKEELQKEANVICEEIKMYRDNPQRHVFDKIKELMYEKPFGISGTGKEDIIKTMKREHIQQKHQEYYHPANTILVVVGNTPFKDIETLAQKLTPTKKGILAKPLTITPKQGNETEERTELTQANLAIGIHYPFRGEQGRFAAELFSTILGSGMSSRLFTEVREKRGLVYGIKTDLDLGQHYGYLIIFAGTEPTKVKEVIKITQQEYEKMNNVTEKELQEAKLQLIGSRKVESEGSNETALNLLLEELSGDAHHYYEHEKNINRVTLNDIKTLAKLSSFSTFVLTTKKK